jgi:transcriptional regulator with XRE-family HTH domain
LATMNAAEKIEKYRTSRGLSLTELARIVEVPKSNLSDLINGNREITLSVAVRVARGLCVTVDWLTRDEYDWPPPDATEGVVLSPAEREALALAKRLSKGDPELQPAIDRLMGVGYVAPEALGAALAAMMAGGAPASVQLRSGAVTAEQEKAATATKGKRTAPNSSRKAE